MKKIILSILIYVLFLLNISALYTQCPPNISEFITIPDVAFEPLPMDTWGYVEEVKYKANLDGTIEIKVDWGTLHNYNRYNLTDEEFKSIMYKAIILKLLGLQCNFVGTKTFIFYEEGECKIEKKCYIKVDKNTEIICIDEGWQWALPFILTHNLNKYLPVSKNIVCGTSCCQYIFTVECEGTTHGDHLHIISKTKIPSAGSSCDATTSTDCLTGEIKSCEPYCE